MIKVLFAVAVFAGALSATVSAAATWEDVSRETALTVVDVAPATTSGVRLAGTALRATVNPSTSTPPFLVNFVATGPAVSGVPCYNCVSGARGTTLGLPGPFNYVPLGTVQQYNISWTTVTYSGSCKAAIAITAGSTTIDSFSFNVPNVAKMGTYDLGFNRNRPSYHGSAVVVGKVTCGTLSATTQAPIVFQ